MVLCAKMITDVEDYFNKGCGRCDRFDTEACSSKIWASGVATLRKICWRADLHETVKWGHPCYMHAGRNIAIIGAFQRDFRLSFFDGGLLKDSDNVLQKTGPNVRQPDMFRFVSNEEPAKQKNVIIRYLEEAKGYAERGLKSPKDDSDIVLPHELLRAMEQDAELAMAFRALTRGRQRSYVYNLNSAKRSETRVKRIAKYRAKILSGKGATER